MTEIEHRSGHMATIILDPTAKPISADELVRLLLAHGVTAAKIIRQDEIEPANTMEDTRPLDPHTKRPPQRARDR
jgi:hypothetical protein